MVDPVKQESLRMFANTNKAYTLVGHSTIIGMHVDPDRQIFSFVLILFMLKINVFLNTLKLKIPQFGVKRLHYPALRPLFWHDDWTQWN